MAIETTSDLSLVGTSQIVDSAVTSAKIIDGAVTSAKIGAGAVTSAKISDGAITSAKIAAGAVNSAAISSGTATSGQILQANGSTGVSWATPAAGGGLTLIATATPSAASSFSFTSIPTTYKHLLVRWFGVYQSVNTDYWAVRVNSDTDSKYAWRFASWDGLWISTRTNVTTTTFGSTSDPYGAIVTKTATSSTAYDQHGSGWLLIYDYASTSLRRNIESASWGDQNGTPVWNHVEGYYTSTGTAITSIDFVRTGTQTITGTFYLYGVS